MAGNDVKSGYWFSKSQVPASNIRAGLFTHLFCANAGVDPTTYEVTIADLVKTKIATFSSTVKLSNPQVKTLLSIGGDGATAQTFAAMAGQPSFRKSFIDSSISVARKNRFDGLDLQWLYPYSETDMSNLDALLKEWQEAVVSEARKFHKTRLLLVATVYFSPYIDSILYPVATIRKTMDWVNVYAFDFYTPTSSDSLTGPCAALYNPKLGSLCGHFGINTWIQEGLAAKNIVFGIPFHGWAWSLQRCDQTDPFSPANGAAQGQGISPDGQTDYSNIKKFIQDARNVPLDQEYIIAYAYSGTTWIGYENEETITIKISVAKKLGLLGYFAWNIAGDDEYNSLANAASKEWGGV